MDQGGEERGYDAGKKVTGRKCHVIVDTLGLILSVVVTAGNVQDRDGGKKVLEKLHQRTDDSKRLELIWADGGYRGELIEWVEDTLGWMLEIIVKTEGQIGFQVLPRRWVVEQTFAWLNRQPHLSRDYEHRIETCYAWIYIVMSLLMLRRLVHA